MIKVAITGARGKMGTTAQQCLTQENGFEVVGLVGRGDSLAEVIAANRPDVVLELSTAASAPAFIHEANSCGIPVVVGSTGISDFAPYKEMSKTAPILFVPNFSVGAVLMMQFAEKAARYFADAEIIELHHEKKLDAPSGTAMRTASMIARGRRGTPTVEPTKTIKAEGARGGEVESVPVHSIRLPGLLAHQEVLFGGQGEVLTLRHDSMNRSSFEYGIQLCCRKVLNLSGFHVGMESVMD